MPRCSLLEVNVRIEDDWYDLYDTQENYLPRGTPLQLHYTQSLHYQLTEQEATVIVQSTRRTIHDRDWETEMDYAMLLGVRLQPVHPVFLAAPGALYDRPLSLFQEGTCVARGYVTRLLES